MAQFGSGPPVLSARFVDAVQFAVEAHGTQQRKGTEIPYTAHLLGVASFALENGADEDQAIAAMLHDCVEDADVTVEQVAQRFGGRVAGMVADCTDTLEVPKTAGGSNGFDAWKARKEAYIASLSGKSADSLLVSASDKTHNARAIADDLVVVGSALWRRFSGGRDGSLWYYRSLADAFNQLLPGTASRRLEAAVREMERLAEENR